MESPQVRFKPFYILDIFRGLAAVWVVMYHIRIVLPPNYLILNGSPALARFASYGQLGVVLFFVISGYCITATAFSSLLNGKTATRYARDRIRRIYPTYFASLVLAVAVLGFDHWAVSRKILKITHLVSLQGSLKYWIANLFLCQVPLQVRPIIGVYWSLSYEIFFYLIVGIFLAASLSVARRYSTRHGVTVFISLYFCLTSLSLLCLMVKSRCIFPLDMWHYFSLGAMLFFALEVSRLDHHGLSAVMRRWIYASTFLSVALAALFAILRANTSFEWQQMQQSSRMRTLVCLIFVIFLALIHRVDSTLAKQKILHPFFWLGACSYSLYVTHRLSLPYTSHFLARIGLDGPRYWINLLLQTGIAIVLGRIFYICIEREFISRKRVRQLESEGVN